MAATLLSLPFFHKLSWGAGHHNEPTPRNRNQVMKIHEYQAKHLFRQYNVPVPEGDISTSVEGVAEVANKLGLPVAVKAQIHAGGRGKGGGVKISRSADEVLKAAESILGMTLVTKQTGPEGRLVKTVLIEKGVSIKKELYLSIIPDRVTASITIVTSQRITARGKPTRKKSPNL